MSAGPPRVLAWMGWWSLLALSWFGATALLWISIALAGHDSGPIAAALVTAAFGAAGWLLLFRVIEPFAERRASAALGVSQTHWAWRSACIWLRMCWLFAVIAPWVEWAKHGRP